MTTRQPAHTARHGRFSRRAAGIGSAALLCALAAAPSTLAGQDEEVARHQKTLAVAGLTAVALEVPVGEVEVKGGPVGDVRLEAVMRCKRPVKPACREAARRVEVRSETDDDRASFDFAHWPKGHDNGLTLSVTLSLPRELDLHTELGVGELQVAGVEGDVSLEVGVGEITVHAAEPAVRRVSLEVGVGEASLHLGDRTIEGKGFLGSDLDWDKGSGAAKLHVECGVGEIAVHLD